MPIPSSVEVAVVGAGPVGLTTAVTLRRRGIDAVVIDASTGPSTESRAVIIHSRTLEVLESLGITDTIIERGGTLTKAMICDRSAILAKLDFSSLTAKYPMMVAIPQCETERVLREEFEALGGTIHWSSPATAISDDGEQVQIQVDTLEGQTTLTAAYVVAADGRGSIIREALDIPFPGGEYDASFICADGTLAAESSLQRDILHIYFTPAGILLFVPLPDGVWRMVATLDQAPKHADVALFQRIADERGFPGIVIEELVWTNRFHIHHRLAQNFRKGRVLLAGDAAHVHSPVGAQGMNTGIQDGARLGQILGEALREGKSSDTDLDRYETERRPVAQHVVGFTHRMTSVALLKLPFFSLLRSWVLWTVMSFPWFRQRLTRRLAELEK